MEKCFWSSCHVNIHKYVNRNVFQYRQRGLCGLVIISLWRSQSDSCDLYNHSHYRVWWQSENPLLRAARRGINIKHRNIWLKNSFWDIKSDSLVQQERVFICLPCILITKLERSKIFLFGQKILLQYVCKLWRYTGLSYYSTNTIKWFLQE